MNDSFWTKIKEEAKYLNFKDWLNLSSYVFLFVAFVAANILIFSTGESPISFKVMMTYGLFGIFLWAVSKTEG